MLPAPGDLLMALGEPSTVPAWRVRLFDRSVGVRRLRWSLLHDGDAFDGPAAATVTADGALIRARIDAATGVHSVQRVETPQTAGAAAFETWTPLGTADPAARLGCAAAGDRVLLASVHTDGEQVIVRESSDGGATFASPAVVAGEPGGVSAVAGAIRTDGSAAVAWATSGGVIAVRRTGVGSWSTPAAWSHTLAAIDGLAMYDAPDYACIVSGTDTAGRRGAWSTMLGDGITAPPG